VVYNNRDKSDYINYFKNIYNYEFIEKKEYDVLLYGSIHPKHYPFKKRLFELILKNENKYKDL